MSYFEIKDEIYRELLVRSVDDKLISHFYKKLLETLINKFSHLVYLNDENKTQKVPCWHANLERAIGKIKQESTLVLPVISIARQTDRSDDKRRRQEAMVIFEKCFDKEKNRAVRVASLPPVPITIAYKLNIWTKYQQDMDQLSEQVRRFFNPHLLIPTSHSTQTTAYLAEETSNITLTVEDGQDRIIRRSYDISIETYVPNPKFIITHTGKIETFNSEIHLDIT